MTIRLATFNVENLFARAKALDTTTWAEGQPALTAFDSFNKIAAKKAYTEADKAKMLHSLETLRILVRTSDGLRLNKHQVVEATSKSLLTHMIEETARHCGHLDLLRESIDGKTGE